MSWLVPAKTLRDGRHIFAALRSAGAQHRSRSLRLRAPWVWDLGRDRPGSAGQVLSAIDASSSHNLDSPDDDF
ncbi:hypothetical protein ACMHYB_32980 [Sorangium sp. So ce1128]